MKSFADAPALPNTAEIKLEAGDKIHITVYGEENITGNYQVDTGGYIALPLAGSVKAAGLTPPELEKTRQVRCASGQNLTLGTVASSILRRNIGLSGGLMRLNCTTSCPAGKV